MADGINYDDSQFIRLFSGSGGSGGKLVKGLTALNAARKEILTALCPRGDYLSGDDFVSPARGESRRVLRLESTR